MSFSGQVDLTEVMKLPPEFLEEHEPTPVPTLIQSLQKRPIVVRELRRRGRAEQAHSSSFANDLARTRIFRAPGTADIDVTALIPQPPPPQRRRTIPRKLLAVSAVTLVAISWTLWATLLLARLDMPFDTFVVFPAALAVFVATWGVLGYFGRGTSALIPLGAALATWSLAVYPPAEMPAQPILLSVALATMAASTPLLRSLRDYRGD